ncbi:MAG: diaminobutyrate--2-oxoglutarate transaminase [Planctomycetaceae bacterium]|nr:diaminobutyrate--2-oxoglutarate transaminase [Planctomycetaceae bacterium]
MEEFERLESNVRGYCRSFPTVFQTASGATLTDEQGKSYIDFFAGAGALNYGHNPPAIRDRLIEYLRGDGVIHALDMSTTAKRQFLTTLDEVILAPRRMDYKVMFPGPTGTNAVEAALKLARKVTNRHNIISFTNGFHGMTLGSLALTGNASKRAGAGVPLNNVVHMPYCDYLGLDASTTNALERYLEDTSSGVDIPAAFILETVQAEGGVNIASTQWLAEIQRLAKHYGILLIIDDIQVGCGRTGRFFSFEGMGLDPDIICLSKSLSGFGLPLAITLLKPEHDVFSPGEHNGTFRGHNAAFVTATAALDLYWKDHVLSSDVNRKAKLIREVLLNIADEFDGSSVRGRGMIQGIEFECADTATEISRAAFQAGLIIETAGPRDEVLKVLPPLTIPDQQLLEGLQIVTECSQQIQTNSVG